MLPSPMAFSPYSNSSRSLNLRTMAESCNSYLSCQNRDILLILFKNQHFLKGKARGGFVINRCGMRRLILVLAILYCMSKVKVKFIYGGDHTVSVRFGRFRSTRPTTDPSTGAIPQIPTRLHRQNSHQKMPLSNLLSPRGKSQSSK